MTSALRAYARTAVIPDHTVWGAAAGLVGGVGMGIWMSVSRPVMDTAMITMVAGLLGTTNAFAGWLIHLSIALFAGVRFGALLGPFARSPLPAAVLGLVYGAAWWTFGALWIMSANMGMPVFDWNEFSASSLGAHLVFGLLAGLTFATIARATAGRAVVRPENETRTARYASHPGRR
ncbi:hypothetical protein [Streptomyces sp. TBY4]|uniref:hypothetical protein n=1 Tax=Streptomyces sp. TBY4 TaxID=2962030 RepID=UPI0020B7ED1C|nr:hypothetical protein [Streptomyces sp. TBY4]MCP3757011.1 hypothetical protein [Streptomyces sp. TBY4]